MAAGDATRVVGCIEVVEDLCWLYQQIYADQDIFRRTFAPLAADRQPFESGDRLAQQ